MIAGTWLALTPQLALFALPGDPWTLRAGPGVEVQIGESHGFELRTRAHGAFDTDFRVQGLATVELAWLPRIAEGWQVGPVLALDVDTAPCAGTTPPFCDGAALSIGGARTFSRGERIDVALGTEMSQALGDRLALRPRARARFLHPSGFTAAVDAGLHLQQPMLRAEVGFTLRFGEDRASVPETQP
ncbi:MAG: hypothetical protein EP330_13150 [Deltaproteobacteria bacterium]|nr:MAG: hypothetical protein EP330_13150 [Deltaproteobacteria bacterium]